MHRDLSLKKGRSMKSKTPLIFSFVAATYNAAYVTASGGTAALAEAALAQALADGEAYFNIHSTTFPGGEIRGFLVPVPEPTTVGLIVIGGMTALLAARKTRRS